MSKLAKFKRQPTGSSVPREFNRPIEFDQSLADRHVQVVVSSPARASLSMQLGLESDEDDHDMAFDQSAEADSEFDTAQSSGPTVPWDEYTKLQALYQAANEQISKYQTELSESEQRNIQIQQLGKSSLAIAQKGFEDKLKSLRKLASEQEAALSEDERTIDSLRLQIAQLQRSGQTVTVPDVNPDEAAASTATLRRIERENASVRAELEEANAQISALKAEMQKVAEEGAVRRDVPAIDPQVSAASATAAIDAANGDADAAVTKLVAEKAHLEEVIRQMDELIKTKDSEMEELKVHAKAKIAEAKKKMQDLIETAKKRESVLKEKAMQRVEEIRVALEAERDADKAELDQLRANQNNGVSEEQHRDFQRQMAEQSTSSAAVIEQLKSEVTMSLNNLRLSEDMCADLQSSVAAGESTIASLQSELRQSEAHVKKLSESSSAAASAADQLRKQIQSNRTRMSQSFVALKSKTESTCLALKSEMSSVSQECVSLRSILGSLSHDIVERTKLSAVQYHELMGNYRRELKFRRDLFNQIQELKGNIRVFCRVRPLNSMETEKREANIISYPNETGVRVYTPEKDVTNDFEFDQVFHPGSTQLTIFEEVSPLIQSVLDGYNVSIFAYGQTGSGKTYTMEGPPTDRGVNHRTLQMLFERSGEAEQRGDVSYEFSLSILEIYNESIRDLLAASQSTADNLRIVQGKNGTQIVDLTIYDVKSLEEVMRHLKFGSKNRAVGRTDMNEHSSRSHLVMTIYVTTHNKMSGQTLSGKLHLIDLAGSERLSKSGASGDRLKETQAINFSLSALGDVINARVMNNQHIPFRNSVLTQVLQDSLSNNSKTLMIVQISPSDSNVGETLCSLRFASRARAVELGKAKKNVVTNTTAPAPAPAKK